LVKHTLGDGLEKVDLEFDEVSFEQILTLGALFMQFLDVEVQLLQLVLRNLVLPLALPLAHLAHLALPLVSDVGTGDEGNGLVLVVDGTLGAGHV
jgi:hypothetical protein